jgi:hypothetical protein
MAEGWDHDLGRVFNGRAQREAAEIQGNSALNLTSNIKHQTSDIKHRRVCGVPPS